ncbi:MAG: YitT family protein [Muribaculaceae bacterium]|nr:YitT family protein [Muribaculaceae bacterium]
MEFRKYNSLMTNSKDYVFIIFGLMLYAFGFTAFILPHKIVIGGVAGIGTLIYFATDGFISVGVTSFVINILLLAMAYRVVGRTFVLRTIFGVTIVSFGIGFLENIFMGLGHPLIPDRLVSMVLGAILCGLGVGTTFNHNGSSGGTDIIAAMVSKVSNVSIGRTMIYVDMCIVTSSLLLPFDGSFDQRIEARIPTIVYGWMVTFIIAYVCDMIINTNRQAAQFIIFSPKWEEIADRINSEAHRGCTVLDGEGWYSKHNIKILLVFSRKIEAVTIFRIIKSVDENAFVTQGAVNGVYGKGFDTVKVRMKKPKAPKSIEASLSGEAKEMRQVRRSNKEE